METQTHVAPGAGLLTGEGVYAPRGLHRLGVATDFSLRSDFALARALHLPLGVDATLELLHVRPPGRDEEEQGVGEVVERCLRRAVGSARRRLRAREPVGVREEVRVGEPVEEVAAYVQEARPELVVVGRPQLTPERTLRADSTVRALVRRVGAPLLVVVPHPARSYQRPLVAVDFSEDSRRALELTLRLCPAPVRVGVIHAYRNEKKGTGADAWTARLLREQAEERAARGALGRFLAPYRETGRAFESSVREGEPGEVLLAEAAEVGADLLALGMRSGREAALVELVERVLGAVGCDVLVAKEPPA